jgi:plasmid maintenance system killer protein
MARIFCEETRDVALVEQVFRSGRSDIDKGWKLRGNVGGLRSVRVNKRWRLVFR